MSTAPAAARGRSWEADLKAKEDAGRFIAAPPPPLHRPPSPSSPALGGGGKPGQPSPALPWASRSQSASAKSSSASTDHGDLIDLGSNRGRQGDPALLREAWPDQDRFSAVAFGVLGDCDPP